MATKKTNAGKIAAEIGAGIIAAGATAAAGFYFYGSNKAKAHRKIAAKWATEMKKEVLKEAKRLKDATPAQYAKVVDSVSKSYQGMRQINAADVKRAASELKTNWDKVQKEIKNTSRKNVKVVKKIIAKAKPKAKPKTKKKSR